MMARSSWCCALCLVACSFESAGAVAEAPATNTSDGEQGSTGAPATTTTTTTTSPSGTATGSETSSPDIDDTGDETSGTSGADPGTDTNTGTGTGTTGAEVAPACPEPLPDTWVLCEDFEGLGNLANEFAGLNGSGISIGGPGYESPEALQITHFAGVSWVGELLIRFGQGPEANNVALPSQQFEEVWVRMRFRSEQGWPIQGPGDLLSVDGVQDEPGWGTTFKARISSDQTETAIRNSAFTCVYNDLTPCTHHNDGSATYMGGELGSVDVFEESVVDQWHCAVVHARLNSPGNSNGLVEVLVDGQADASLTNLDFRGNRGDLGFNMLAFPTFMQFPVLEDQRRYIDDVVVSTAALSCD